MPIGLHFVLKIFFFHFCHTSRLERHSFITTQLIRSVTLEQSSAVLANGRKKTPLEIHLVYLDKVIYCILKTCCMMYYFPQN